MTATKGFAVGSLVVLAEEYVTLFERPDLRNVICEVLDVRMGNGVCAYRVAPVCPGLFRGGDRAVEVFTEDLATLREVAMRSEYSAVELQ